MSPSARVFATGMSYWPIYACIYTYIYCTYMIVVCAVEFILGGLSQAREFLRCSVVVGRKSVFFLFIFSHTIITTSHGVYATLLHDIAKRANRNCWQDESAASRLQELNFVVAVIIMYYNRLGFRDGGLYDFFFRFA